MELGIVGLGRMGANMARRLLRAGHRCVVFDRSPEAMQALTAEGAETCESLEEMVAALAPPRHLLLMVPAGIVERLAEDLFERLTPDDAVIDGGNSHYPDDIARARRFAARGLHWIDMGTSGGVYGLERGYCLMIGGDPRPVARLEPVFRALAPGRGSIPSTPGREGAPSTAEEGFLHCGPPGAGHFVKMVHNGIEYGLMAAYAEGLNVLHRADAGETTAEADAETTPLAEPENYRYRFDLGAITELWRRGSVISSWLLDLTAAALVADPKLERFGGWVSDSGEGRWTLAAANDLGVPAHVLAAALFERFASRDLDTFQNQVLSAMRMGFGGHAEKK